MIPLTLLNKTTAFPNPKLALTDPNGLLAIGGDLSSSRLMEAYRCGIFPWYNDDEPIIWWSPNPRAILVPHEFHLSRSLKKFIKQTDFTVTINYDFYSVINACALSHGETWITRDIISAYCKLHQLGFAHSIEVWQNRQLIGGLYGVAQGALFSGESMFSHQTNGSKIALYAFCLHFIKCGGQLIDCQVLNAHTASLGAINISRDDYLTRLKQLQNQSIDEQCWLKQELN